VIGIEKKRKKIGTDQEVVAEDLELLTEKNLKNPANTEKNNLIHKNFKCNSKNFFYILHKYYV